ncbi:hypothetical protein JW905_17860 [bacterium]|nr:hypothetical protein [candidate division CSSED10-310 bacterium]
MKGDFVSDLSLGKKVLFPIIVLGMMVGLLELTGFGLRRFLGYRSGADVPAGTSEPVPADVFSVRCPERLGQPFDYRILALGDSFTYGAGVAMEESYPAQLEQRLSGLVPDKRIAVLNGGRSGRNLADGAAALDAALRCHRFDLVLWQLYRNDVDPSSDYYGRTMPFATRQAVRLSRHSDLFYSLLHRILIPRWSEQYDELLKEFYDSASDNWRRIERAFGEVSGAAGRTGVQVIVFVYPAVEFANARFIAEEAQLEAAAGAAGLETVSLRPEIWPDVESMKPFWASPEDRHPSSYAHSLVVEKLIAATGLVERIR